MSSVRERIGPYEVLAPLGAGGMGEVYAARDPVLGRKVAIKVLPIRLASDRESLSRFTQEARSASALNHPNIVTIHEVGIDDGRPFIVMEHIDGRDLRSYVRDSSLTTRKTLDIAAQIADGLAAAHEQGIVHRDLKPENLMVTKDGFVKILDFGLAKIVRPGADGDDTTEEITQSLSLPSTNPGTILGTVGYMSPEQACGHRVDFRSDQFALGSILYELATGEPAFDADNAIDTLSRILHDEPPPIPQRNAKAPAPFCWIVERLLEKDPAERYASTRDLARELRTLRDRVAAETGADSLWPAPTVGRRTSRVLSRHRTATVVAAVALTIVILLTIGFALRRGLTGTAASAPSKKYIAVMRFKDLSGEPNGQLVVDGLAETLSTRLGHFSTVQVMRPSPEALAANDVVRAAKELGANVVLTGSMQRAGDQLRVGFRIIDVAKGVEQPGDMIDGSVSDLFSIEDRLAASVASSLQLGAPSVPIQPADTTISRRRFLEALGYLRRYDNEQSVDEAIRILEELGAKSNSASVQAALGRAYLSKFQLTHDPKWAVPATAACERAVSADPHNPDVHVTLGELRRQTGRLPEALTEFKAALAQEPNNADAVLGLADTYNAMADLKDAETNYQRAILLQPNFWGGYNRLGFFYFTHSRYDDAARMFKKVMELVPDNLRAYNNLGAMYEQMGRYEDAINVFSQSIARKPTDQAYSNLGTCYYFLGRYSEAADAYQKALKIAPRRYLLWSNLADAYRWIPGADAKAAQAYDQAIAFCRSELQFNPAAAGIRARMAECLAKRGHANEANAELKRAFSTDPTNVAILYNAAIIANVNGDESGAAQWLKRAVAAGYDRFEIDHDPEFALLRQTDVYKRTIAAGPQ